MNQTSHIVMLLEGSPLTVNQWDTKLRERKWALSRSDDGHPWVGVRQGASGASVKLFVDNCGSEKQKIWYTIIEIDFNYTSGGHPIYKGGQHVYRVMVVHIGLVITRSARRAARVNFGDPLVLSAYVQADLIGETGETSMPSVTATTILVECKWQVLFRTVRSQSCFDVSVMASTSLRSLAWTTRSSCLGVTSTWPISMKTSSSTGRQDMRAWETFLFRSRWGIQECKAREQALDTPWGFRCHRADPFQLGSLSQQLAQAECKLAPWRHQEL